MVLLGTFLLMLVLSTLALAVSVFTSNSLATGKTQFQDKGAHYLAEAGWQRARQALIAGTWTAAAAPGNSYTESLGAGEYQVTIVDNGSSSYTITSDGYVPSIATSAARRRLLESALSVTMSNGTNQSLTATASASSSSGAHTASKANDGDLGTFWGASNQGDGEWLNMDYGGSPPTLNRVVIDEDANIDGITLAYSDDGSSWTTYPGLTVVESPAQTWTLSFTAAAHRYARATFTASASNKKVSVKEMESYNRLPSALGAGAVTTQW